jgi:hypothetical protein
MRSEIVVPRMRIAGPTPLVSINLIIRDQKYSTDIIKTSVFVGESRQLGLVGGPCPKKNNPAPGGVALRSSFQRRYS